MIPYDIKQYENKGVEIVNYFDIRINFWKFTYLVHISAQDHQFLVNADNRQDALDYVMDHIVDCGYVGLYSDNPSDSFYYDNGDYLSAGNCGYKFTTHNIYIDVIS